MKRILHVIHGLNLGGAETLIYNIIRKSDLKCFHFDFVIQNPSIGNTSLKEYIEKIGGRIFLITDFRKNIFKHFRDIKSILAKGYDVVHIHMNSLINPIPVYASSKFANKVIIHSHNTSNGKGGLFGKIIHKLNTHLFLRNRFINLACGNDAGKWMFPSKKYTVINNAIDLEKFSYSFDNRTKIREEYEIPSDAFIIGHIGRFLPVKNQRYLVDILFQLRSSRQDIDSYLLLVGTGPQLNEIKDYANSLGLNKYVKFTGPVQNTSEIYSAFDIFLLPSLYEGFAFVAVEAQASGLYVIASENNTKEINITGNVNFLSLEEKKDRWIEKITSLIKAYDRKKMGEKLVGSEYDLNSMIKIINKIYNS